MKVFTKLSLACCLGLAVAGVAAQDMKKDAPKDAKKMSMTMTECNDYMAMAKKDAAKKDAMKETMCKDMMDKAAKK